MKIILTLILMTISTLTYAKPVLSNPESFNLVQVEVAGRIEVEYAELISKVNTILQENNSAYTVENVRAVSTAVLSEEDLCDKEISPRSYVEKLECKKTIADLIEKMSADVIKYYK